jgi:hypothetical protein
MLHKEVSRMQSLLKKIGKKGEGKEQPQALG